MLLGDCKIPVTTHTTPVVIHDIAFAVEVALLRSDAWFHASILGIPQKGEKGQISSCEQDNKNKTKSYICGQTAQMVVDKIITKLLGRTSERL